MLLDSSSARQAVIYAELTKDLPRDTNKLLTLLCAKELIKQFDELRDYPERLQRLVN